jgi:4-hydroxybenzoate-CoA ligase/benzoate-CoA ligase
VEDVLSLPDAYNAAVDFIDHAPASADKVAFIDRAGTHTYGDLQARVDAAGWALLELGLSREDRVAMVMLDTFDFPAVFWGAIKAGIVPICMNTLLTTESYEAVLKDCEATALIVSRELLERFTPILDDLPHLQHVVVAGGDDSHHPALDALLAAAPGPLDAADTKKDDIAFWLYSSGSTGLPKGVRHRHGSPAHTAHTYSRTILGLTESDVVYSAAKLFFAYGLGNAMTFPLRVGATAVLFHGRPTPGAVMEIMAKHRPTVFFGVPTLYAALLAEEASAPVSGSSRLRLCISAGEALSEVVGSAWEQRFGLPILDGIGSTEMLHIFLSNRPGDVRYGTSGIPVPGYQARIVDESGDEVEAGELGELLIRGPSTAAGYWNRDAKEASTFEGSWTHTGDKYLRDGDGYYHYGGRSDDMFKVGGNWVSPFEVESAIAEHDAVLEAAVIGRPDEAGNLKPMAFVILTGDRTGDEGLATDIQEQVRARLEPWKYPRWVEFVDDFPRTATGKIQRFRLRELDRTP